MAAMLRVSSVSLNGELGEMRANDAQMAWRGSSGAIAVVDLSSVTSAEWCQGRLSISHCDKDGAAQTLTLEGFGADYHESIAAHFEQHAHIFVVGGCEDTQKDALPTLLGSTAKTENFADAIKPRFEPEEPRAVEENTAPVQEAKVKPQTPEAARGTMVQRRLVSSDDDEGVSCLFDEGFAPKAFDARTHPYFLSRRNAAYGTSLFEGYVWKQSAWVRKWEKRYMVLSTTGLFSYKARAEITPSVVFEGVVSCSASEDKSGKKGFCIVTRDGLLVKRHFIAAENDAARDQWVTKINVALLRHQH
jgi:hypothetical protein